MEAEGGEQKRVEVWDPLWEGRESVATSHPNAGKTPFKDGRVLTCRVGQGKEGRSAYVFSLLACCQNAYQYSQGELPEASQD